MSKYKEGKNYPFLYNILPLNPQVQLIMRCHWKTMNKQQHYSPSPPPEDINLIMAPPPSIHYIIPEVKYESLLSAL